MIAAKRVYDPARWAEFKKRYYEELRSRQDLLGPVRAKAEKGKVTLVYGSKGEKLNNAAALREYLEKEEA